MFNFFANIFGYLLNYIYILVNNYGLAIIIFTVLIKLLLVPLSVSQQKNMKKTVKVQEKMKILQFKYKNDKDKLNQEVMELYKQEKMNPLSGCLTAIVQMILLLSIFYMVRSPLTYMVKISEDKLNNYQNQIKEEEKGVNSVYPELDIIKNANWLIEKNSGDAEVSKTKLEMNFLGLDLNKVPQQNMSDFTVYIIPALYIVSSFISIRMATAMQQVKKKEEKSPVIDGTTGKELVVKEENELDTMAQTNKMMSWMMPIMSISIAFVAPLGLALYWLMNNILMIIERLVLNKVMKSGEES